MICPFVARQAPWCGDHCQPQHQTDNVPRWRSKKQGPGTFQARDLRPFNGAVRPLPAWPSLQQGHLGPGDKLPG
jgi:hypothetical protein